MISLAVLYAVLDAPFLFAVQIIVYTGAILMLFLFVLMLVGVDASDSVVETIRGQRLFAVLGGLVLGLVLVTALEPDHPRHRGRARGGQRGRQRPGAGQHLVLQATSSPSRPPRRCSSPRRSARWCWPIASGSRPSPARPTRPPCGCRTTRVRQAPGPAAGARCLRAPQRRRHRCPAARRHRRRVVGVPRPRRARHRALGPGTGRRHRGGPAPAGRLGRATPLRAAARPAAWSRRARQRRAGSNRVDEDTDKEGRP